MDVNEAWKKTCKVLLKEEIGELDTYKNYLLKYIEPVRKSKSEISGKDVFVGERLFCEDARFIAYDETEQYGRLQTAHSLNINQIKDMESIVEALQENMFYGASTILGTSGFVENSCDVFDSTCVQNSWLIRDASKYIAYCNALRSSEYCFGSMHGGTCKFLIKCYNPYKNERCLEALRSKPISDCYYVANLQGCQDCMFSFNLRNTNRAIGNLVLPRDEYVKIKEKLLEDMRATLEAKKALPTIIEILADAKKVREKDGKGKMAQAKSSNPDIRKPLVPDFAEKAFQNATQVVLGKKLEGCISYERYMAEYAVSIDRRKSALGGGFVSVPQVPYYAPAAGCFTKMGEALAAGKKSLAISDVLTLTLENAPWRMAQIAYSSPEIEFGSNLNIAECCDVHDSVGAYRSAYVFMSKHNIFSFFSRDCEGLVGCGTMLRSSFCIRCKNSSALQRCYEVADSTSCTDCYFCQNCENVRDSMFCFNAKNLQYAIGNVQLPREQYMKIKKLVLDEIAGKLERDKELALSIYNVGCGGKR